MLYYTLSLSDMNELKDTELSWVQISAFLCVYECVCVSVSLTMCVVFSVSFCRYNFEISRSNFMLILPNMAP